MVARQPSTKVRDCAAAVLTLLRKGPATREQLALACGASKPTVTRAIEWLKGKGAPIEYRAADERRLHLADFGFALPIEAPDERDLVAALTAAGLVEQLGSRDVARRAHQLVRDLATKVSGTAPLIRPGTLIVRQSTSLPVNWSWLLELLRACRRSVVHVEYQSAWSGDRTTHELEPWEIRLHEGVFYVRGFSRWEKSEWTLRLAGLTVLRTLKNERPRAPVVALPPEQESGFGIDEHCPGHATVRVSGPVGRWQRFVRWASEQDDDWDAGAGVLTRQLHYRSSRELARRLASLADGIDSIEPPELQDEVLRILRTGHARLAVGEADAFDR